MFRETAETYEQLNNQTDLQDSADGANAELSRHLLRAVEAYKASCEAAGEEPSQEDAWLVLLSALQLEESK